MTDTVIVENTVTEKTVTYEKQTVSDFDSFLLSGRIITDSDGLHLDWTYSGFTVRGWFSGKIYADVTAKGQLGYMLHTEVDGVDSATRYDLGSGRILLADVEKGYHTVTVRKTTEGCTTTVVLHSLEFSGTLDEKPEAPKLKLEVIGDSISCGVGAKPESVTETDWDYIRDCDSYNAYSTMTARRLGADIHLTSVSGWGVLGGSTDASQKIPDIYGYTSYISSRELLWDFSEYQPDVIVVALGTNDGASSREALKEGASAFLKTLREKNPDARIIWMYGMMNDTFAGSIAEAVAEQNDEKISYLSAEKDLRGGWGHPSYAGQVRYADNLVAEIERLLGIG